MHRWVVEKLPPISVDLPVSFPYLPSPPTPSNCLRFHYSLLSCFLSVSFFEPPHFFFAVLLLYAQLVCLIRVVSMEAMLLKAAGSPSRSEAVCTKSIRPINRFGHRTWHNCCYLRSSSSVKGILPLKISATATGVPTKKRVDESQSLTLEAIRRSLVRQEDSIIYSLLERSEYCYNPDTYNPNAFTFDGFHGPLVEFMLKETERLHAQVGRYKSPDEHPFFPNDLPDPVLPPLHYPQVLHPIADSININAKVWNMYFNDLLPRLVKGGDDGNYGSAAVCDTMCLQALSKRIHYGKFVAEAKFQASPDIYKEAIRAQDRDLLMNLLTYQAVEDSVKKRVEMKSKIFGQEVPMNPEANEACTKYKIKPSIVADLYGDWIMPLTKEVQIQYLMRRLD
ncbi:hypothetical protein Nepgr_006943 [Nepenthes gracilis]|uniref:chorismate mutase n=1 Tax=Nepenthes gracilis TaxID=150966 RepID=A0AAD3S5Y6_NEPGR|nr:hypothetical protein Nepgr_006943 [Nepenthes gracilis]